MIATNFLHNNIWTSLAGLVLTALGFLDGYKYRIAAEKIREVKSSLGHSRKVINIALSNDVYRVFYFICVDQNLFLLISSLFCLIFMVDMFWAIYTYYPYETYPRRISRKIKRPHIFLYIYNSLIPNRFRRRL